MELSEIQNLFYRSTVSNEMSSLLSDLIIPGGKLSTPNKAMLIHQRGYIARLVDAIGEMYEAVWFVLGDRYFFEICEKYIVKYPSLTYNLSLYGFNFPSFLEEMKVTEEFPFIRELADFEFTFNQVFHAERMQPLNPEIIHQRLSENPSLKLKLDPSMQIKSYENSIYRIWRSCKSEQFFDELENIEEFLCVYKNDEKVQVYNLSKFEFTILHNLYAGLSLEEIFDSLESLHMDPELITRFFFWISSSGIVVSIY